MASIDLLSSLPDDVIFNILSFLPTKLSVATSVLGKRWRFLWAHVPSLHLDRVKLNEYQLETLITTGFDCGIRNLYLYVKFDAIPQSLFNCKTIVDLKLGYSRVSLSAMDNVSLPSLKKFYVYNVVCETDDALPRFLSGCPSLEELIMEFNFVKKDDYVGRINISSPTIKMLRLIPIFCGRTYGYRVIINSPSLRYLQLDAYDLGCIKIPITMISLVEADINLENWFSNYITSYNSTVVKFLRSLSYVKCLKISGWQFVEFIRKGLSCSNVKFDNLTKLELRLNFKWSFLVKFLKVADNLEVLICGQVYLEKGYLCPEPKQVPKCLLSCLRTITFKSMWYNENEFDMVRYFLRNSRVLERMEIFSSPYGCIDLETKFQALKRISLFERGSSACQLAFLPDC